MKTNKEKMDKAVNKETHESDVKPYILNKGLPRFVGRTEFRRLDKVIQEKNALIERFKQYDEERKAYYAGFIEDYNEMKESFDHFNEELMKVVEDGDLDQSDYRKVMKLYRNWLTYKSNCELYRDKLCGARQSVCDIRNDIDRLEALMGQLSPEEISHQEQIISRMFTMRKHLDNLQSKVIIS